MGKNGRNAFLERSVHFSYTLEGWGFVIEASDIIKKPLANTCKRYLFS